MFNYLSQGQVFTVLDPEMLIREIQKCSRELHSGPPHWTPKLVFFKTFTPIRYGRKFLYFKGHRGVQWQKQEQTQHLLLPIEELPQSKHRQEQILSHFYFHVVPLGQSSCARTTPAPDCQLAQNSHFKASSIELSPSKNFTGCNCQFNLDIWSSGLSVLWG